MIEFTTFKVGFWMLCFFMGESLQDCSEIQDFEAVSLESSPQNPELTRL